MQQRPTRGKIKFPPEIISHTAVPKIGETHPNLRSINQKKKRHAHYINDGRIISSYNKWNSSSTPLAKYRKD